MRHSIDSVAAVTLCGLLLLATATEAKEPVAPPIEAKKPVAPPKKPVSPPPLEWYVKTTVELLHPGSGLLIRDTRSGIFGQLVASNPGWDPHDIPAFGDTQFADAAVVFIHGKDWGDRAGEYLSDYRSAGTKADDWEFTVHSALAPGEVTLRWEGLFQVKSTEVDGLVSFTKVRVDEHDLLKDLHLVDLTTGQVIDVFIKAKGKKPAQWIRSYSFHMGGATRRDFRWVLGDVKKHHLRPFSEPLEAASMAQSGKSGKLSSLQVQQLNAVQQGRSNDKFGSPPAIRN